MKPRRAVCTVALALAAVAAGAQAPDRGAGAGSEYPPVYRVELIVFEHVGGDSDRRRASDPADFTGRLDPLVVARANDAVDEALSMLRKGALPMLPDPDAAGADAPRLTSRNETLVPIPPPFAALTRLSEPIGRALDRLLDSAAHAPVATRAWVQLAARERTTPPVRIHDATPVATLPPAHGLPLFFPSRLALPAGANEDGTHRSRQLFRPAAPRLAIYRLDGTARLRRRQFLHLDLDLVWQQREPAVGPRPAAPGDTEPRHPRPWLLHRLQQSRVVEPGRLEYFDSSRFGVLARVTRFEQVVPEPEQKAETVASDAAGPPDPAATGNGR